MERIPFEIVRGRLEDVHACQALTHTLNRTTNLLMPKLRSLYPDTFGAWNVVPTTFEELASFIALNEAVKCTQGIIYALRLYYLTYLRNYHVGEPKEHKIYHDDLHFIVKYIPTTAHALRLFPNTVTFKHLPAFIHYAYKEQTPIPTTVDEAREQQRRKKQNARVLHKDSEFRHINEYTATYINSFNAPADTKTEALQKAQSYIRLAILQHGVTYHIRRCDNSSGLKPHQIIVGNLPPADQMFTAFSSSYPMTTAPSILQQTIHLENHPLAPLPIAINFVMCEPMHINHLLTIPEPLGDPDLMAFTQALRPVNSNHPNNSIDFLPHGEYLLYRVTTYCDPKDPEGILPSNYPPSQVVIYQGDPMNTISYTFGSATEVPLPTPETRVFPITFDAHRNPINFDTTSNVPYTTTTVQSLFKRQPCVLVDDFNLQYPDRAPTFPAELWTHARQIYHVTEIPERVPYSLAIRLIPVFTTTPIGTVIYRAWALPHLVDALRDPEIQFLQNRLSYFYQHRHDHPEFPYIDHTHPESPLQFDGNGESVLGMSCYPLFATGDSPDSTPDNQSCLSEDEFDDDYQVVKFQQDKIPITSKHQAFLAVTTRLSSQNLPQIENPEPTRTPDLQTAISASQASDTENFPLEPQLSYEQITSQESTDETQSLPETQTNLEIISGIPAQRPISHANSPENPTSSSNPTATPFRRLSQAVSQILAPKTPKEPQNDSPTDSNHEPDNLDTKPPATNVSHAKTRTPSVPNPPRQTPQRKQTPRPATHPTFSYPPTVQTFFTDDTDDDQGSNQEPKHIQPQSPDALTSSTRTDFTYPPIEDLTKTLLKYAKNANLRKLAYPTDLLARRRHFNAFMDNLRIVCNISPWTRQVFDLWPQQVSYSHPFVGTALYNLIFTNVCDPCQKHIIDGPPDARTALFTLRRHCAPLTPDHIERTREAFCAIKQPHHEVATSYLNRIRLLTRDCYHAGIPNTDAELIKRAIRGGSNHHFYAASYQRFDADIRRAELNDEALPPFSELESHLLNIDDSRGLTIPSQTQRNYNQHAHSARQSPIPNFTPRQATTRIFTPRQNQAFSSLIRPYTNHNNASQRPPQRPQQQHNHRHHRGPPPSHPPQRPQQQHQQPNNRRPQQSFSRPTNNNNRGNRPPTRPPTSNTNQRRPFNQNTSNQNRPSSNAANIVCNNCGRLGHYARQCTNPARTQPSNRGPPSRSSSNNENTAPRTNQRAYFATDSAGQTTQEPQRSNYRHQAFHASSLDHLDDMPDTAIWPNTTLPQMEINRPLLSRDYLPSANHAPPNSGATEYFPDDPNSAHQRFGPPHLCNWLPDSGATSHYTPVFSDLHDVEPCSVPISLADGSTKLSTHKGTTECYFTTDDGQKSILGLTDVYYVEGLSHRLLSLTSISATQNFSVMIKNRATIIHLPNDTTYTWPLLQRELPQQQAFAAISHPPIDLEDDNLETEIFDTTANTVDPDQRQPIKTLPLELVSRRLAHRNFRNLMVGSLHQTWNDHVLSPTIDPNTWPIKISISQKTARNKTPQRQGTEPFHRIHLDLMRNPFRYGLTTSTNFSAYLFIVTTPGKLTGWIGLPTESTTSILKAMKSWLTETELHGRTQSVRFIRTDAGTAFTSSKFVSECSDLGIKVEAAAPEHQEMNGICEAKWREVHNTANILLNNARLGGAFFHHAHAYAVHIVNVCPAKNVTDQDGNPITPYEFSYTRKPSLANFRVFGCPTFFKRYEPKFQNKLITNKQQLQRASRGIFLGFPDNSAGWLVHSPDQPQSLIITRDAYFDEDFNSALCFDSKPFAGAVPIRAHFNPNGLRSIQENTEPSTIHQTGSAANLGNPPSSFVNVTIPQQDSTDDDDLPDLIPRPTTNDDDEIMDNRHGPTPPSPHQVNYVHHQTRHSDLQKQMTIYFQECDECPPSIDPIQSAMLTIDKSNADPNNNTPNDDPVDKYLPEPQSLKAVLKLDDDVRSAWLHAIKMEVKNLIDHDTFTLGETPRKNELIIPVKLVLKAKQTATGKLEKLKARLVARGDMEKRRMKKTKAAYQQQIQQQRQEIAETAPDDTPKVQPIEIPQPFEDTWSPCASSRGVKLLLSTICASRRTLKSADFIGAYLQAKVIGRHFVKLPLEYAYHFPEYAKFFGIPLLLNKGIYGLVYSGKYWNIEFSEWLYSQGFIQSQSEPSYFVFYDKFNQWLRLLFFVDDMLYAGSNDAIEKQFEDSVNNRFDVKFLGSAQWFLQMRIHQHRDSSYTLDQHRYVLNMLQRYDPNSEFPERETPFPPDYTFSKDNRPMTNQDKARIEQRHLRLPFRSAVCTLLYLAYNTRADILFAVCKLAKACICPGELDFRALTWLIGYLRRRPYYALKFYPDGTDNPIYEICCHHRIPYADLIVFSDASWQDCPDTGRSTVGYMIFRNGALIEANSTMPTPIAMSTSEAEYMAACSATMAAAHIRMLLYDMLYLGTKQWRESTQRLPTTPAILMIDNEATVQIAKNGKLTRKTRHIERRFHFVRQGQQDGTHQLHWIPCDSQLADILTKTQLSGKIDPHLTKIFCVLPDHMLSPSMGP